MKEDLKDFKERKKKEIYEAYEEDLKQAKHRYEWLLKQAVDRLFFAKYNWIRKLLHQLFNKK